MSARERLSGKVAVVTGAGSRAPGIGIGRATSVLIAREGASVVLLDNRREWAEETLRMIDEEGGNAFVVECDVTQPSSCESAVEEILSNVDGIDILVNNVGIGGPAGTAIDVDPAEWDQAMAVNVKSMMLMAKYCIPEMITRGGGSMINIASMAGIRGGHTGRDLSGNERCGCEYDARHGRASRCRRHPRELRCARLGVHSPGCHPGIAAGATRVSAACVCAED